MRLMPNALTPSALRSETNRSGDSRSSAANDTPSCIARIDDDRRKFWVRRALQGSTVPICDSASWTAMNRGPGGDRDPRLGSQLLNSRGIGRIVTLAAVVVGAAAIGIVLATHDGTDYTVHARFQNASQLVKGNLVQVSGAPIGKVTAINLTPDGEADVAMHITKEGWTPLHQGTLATIRQASLSSVANRYVNLEMAPNSNPPLKDGDIIPSSRTTSTVDLDQIFNTLDKRTRNALAGVIRGFGDQYDGEGARANRGWLYLNPSLASSSRLFNELNRDTPMLERFIVSSSKLVTDLGEKRDDLSGLVVNLDQTFNAIGNRKEQLARAISLLPPFMRRANTTFVNLRATLDDLKPLVDESKPVAPKLRRLLAQLRPLTQDARPTLRDLTRLIRTRGSNNDLIEATQSLVPLRDAAVGPIQRNGAARDGALPASVKALKESPPELAFGRPSAGALPGCFDDCGHWGVYDAVGGASR